MYKQINRRVAIQYNEKNLDSWIVTRMGTVWNGADLLENNLVQITSRGGLSIHGRGRQTNWPQASDGFYARRVSLSLTTLAASGLFSRRSRWQEFICSISKQVRCREIRLAEIEQKRRGEGGGLFDWSTTRTWVTRSIYTSCPGNGEASSPSLFSYPDTLSLRIT